MTLLVGVEPALAETLTASGSGGTTTVIESVIDVEPFLASAPDEHVVVIGEAIDLPDALTCARDLVQIHPGVGVVLLRSTVEQSVLAEAAASGVREVVAADDPLTAVAAVQRAESGDIAVSPAINQIKPRGKIITVFAAKGGCGKTTLATNLAAVLNADTVHTVALVDLDLEFGDVAVSMQMSPNATLVDAVAAGGKLDVNNVGSLLTSYRPGLDCVLAPVEPGDAEKIPVELVTELLEALRRTHDYVVVDTPSQLSEHVLAAMDLTQHFLLLTTPEIPALKNLRLTLDMLDLLSYNRDARAIVFNRADARAGLSSADIESAIKTPIAVRVPSSHDVPASINRGVPLAVSHPKHPVTVAIRELAEESIIGGPVSESRRSTRHGLKRRLRS